MSECSFRSPERIGVIDNCNDKSVFACAASQNPIGMCMKKATYIVKHTVCIRDGEDIALDGPPPACEECDWNELDIPTTLQNG